jgi:hypothetical protein
MVPDLTAKHQPKVQQPQLSRAQPVRLLLRVEFLAEIQVGECAGVASHPPCLLHQSIELAGTGLSR